MADKPAVPKPDYDDPTERTSDIMAAMKEVEAANTPTPVKTAAEPEVPETPAPEGDKTGKGDKEPVPVDAPVEPVPETPAGEEPTFPEAVAQADKIEPPAHWSKADKERFSEWPKPAQEQFLERFKAQEADYTRKTQAVAELSKTYGTVDEMFTPYKQQLRAAGYTPADAIRNWMSAELALQNPATREQAFKALADGYKVDLAKIAGVAKTEPQAPARMPTPDEMANMTEEQQLQALLSPYLKQATSPYETQIAELRGELDKFKQFQTSTIDYNRQSAIANIANEVNSFAGAKGADGQPLHPYFHDVENDMAVMLAGYHQAKLEPPSLEEIYQRAVRANPSTYERLTAQQKTAADTQRVQEARAKAAQARKAGSSITGAPNGGQPKPNGDAGGLSIRDSIMAAMESTAL